MTTFYLTCVASLLLSFVLFKMWPLWLQEFTWAAIVTIFLGYWITIILRIVIRIIIWHFGVDLELFPNYFHSFVNPKIMLWPIAKGKVRDDFYSPIMLTFRVLSLITICHFSY